jgi:N-acetylglucosamine-6-phosphate deacetylase
MRAEYPPACGESGGILTEVVSTLLIAGTLYDPREIAGPLGLLLEDGRVAGVLHDFEVARRAANQVVDLSGWRVAPGMIDLHTHGFGGKDVNAGSEADLAAMADMLLASGVTAFLPTIASSGPAETQLQVERIASLMGSAEARRAEVLGSRLEGPFISRTKKGAQLESAIRPPDVAELERLIARGPIRMLDFAPEEDADGALLRALVARHVVACIGHTAATFAQAAKAIDAGARHCTHLFNAMPPLEHRAPGAVGALLTDSRTTVEVIADGVHVHPTVLRLVVMARGPEAVALVTDQLAGAGCGEGVFTFVGRQVQISGGAARLADGTLAGSVLTMDQAVRNMVNLVGVAWSDAIRMATLTPATIAGVADRKGHLRPGADADLLVLDASGQVRQTWRAGELVYSANEVR